MEKEGILVGSVVAEVLTDWEDGGWFAGWGGWVEVRRLGRQHFGVS